MTPDQVKAVRKAIEDKCPKVLYTPEPCEICGDTECEDSILQYYIDQCREAEDIIEDKEAEIHRLANWIAAQCDTIDKLREALERASDYANSHSLPYLADIVDTALEARG